MTNKDSYIPGAIITVLGFLILFGMLIFILKFS
jgi:hypothetical protein